MKEYLNIMVDYSFSDDAFEEGGIFTLILAVICFIFMMIMFVHFIYHEFHCNKYRNNNQIDNDKLHSIIALIALTFFILYTLQTVILSSYWLFSAYPNNTFSSSWCLPFYFHHNAYFVGKIGMYLFWFVR